MSSARWGASAAQQGQVDLVDDLDEDLVGGGGSAADDEFVAQQSHGDGGDPGVECFGGGFAARDRAPEDGQPGSGRRVAGLFLELLQEFRGTAGGGEQFTQDRALRGAPVAVRLAQPLQDVASPCVPKASAMTPDSPATATSAVSGSTRSLCGAN